MENTNNWDYVHSLRSNETDDYDDLENAWKLMQQQYYSQYDEPRYDRTKPSSETPLGTFLFDMEMGVYPPPELLLWLYNSFQQYMLAAGKVSLEEVFFGKNVKGIGNYSARYSRIHHLRMLHASIQIEALFNEGKKRSQVQIAEEYIERSKLDIDPEHLLRQLRRFKQNRM